LATKSSPKSIPKKNIKTGFITFIQRKMEVHKWQHSGNKYDMQSAKRDATTIDFSTEQVS